jgi:sterol 3beta-glucosyltransferase
MPDATLRAFVEAGDPPIVVTFGSMAGTDAARITASIRDAAQRTRRRVIVQAGMSQLGVGELSESMLSVDYVPHDWLLPRTAGIVHHGGAGTCAAAIRAGIPQAVIWHMGDQPMWGKLLYQRGVAVAPLRHTRVSARTLARCFERLATDTGMRERAAVLGARVRTENGVQCAMQAIAAVQPARVASRH